MKRLLLRNPETCLAKITPSSLSPSNLADNILSLECTWRSLEVLRSALSRVGAENTPPFYSAVIHSLVRAELLPKARCLTKCFLEDLLRFHPAQRASRRAFDALSQVDDSKFTPGVFSVLITALCKKGLLEEALWVYGNSVDILPSLCACNAILAGLVKAKRCSSSLELYRDIASRGFEPDVITYGILINAHCKGGDLFSARQLFDEMSERGIGGNVVIYTTLIRGLCGQGSMMKAETMFRRMREAGVFPSEYTYNSLMDGYSRSGDPKRALKLYRKMLGDGLRPDVATFGILVDGLCKSGEVSAARNFFVHMAKFGVVPNAIIYTSLIRSYSSSSSLPSEKAVRELCFEMEKLRVSPDSVTFGTLIASLCRSGRPEEADKLLRNMTVEGLAPGVVAYNTLIDGYCKLRDMAKALEVRSRMIRACVEPNMITISTLINRFCKTGDVGSAMNLYRETKIVLDVVTFTALINGHCRNGNVNEALSLLGTMVKIGVSPNARTLARLVFGLCKAGKCSEAIKLFATRGESWVASYAIYFALIDGLCRNGLIREAIWVFSEMRRDGFRAKRACYLLMLRGLVRAKHAKDLMALHSDMIKVGVLQNPDLCDILDDGYRECRDFKSSVTRFDGLDIASLKLKYLISSIFGL